VRIIIVGAGKVGYFLAERLSKEDHEIVIIEADEERRSVIDSYLDVMTVNGNGASPKTLADAGVDKAGLLIAVTDSDEVNMIACMAAKQAGVKKTIARVRNVEYAEEDQLCFNKALGIDMVINPEMVTALEISQILRTPAALDVEDFAGGKVRMLEVKIRSGSSFSGKQLRELDLPKNVLVAGILRKDKMIIPRGDDQIEDYDSVFFIGDKEAICGMEERFTQKRSPVQRVVIVGAGRIGRFLALLLEKSGIAVKVIEKDRRRCEELAQIVDKPMILHGDGTDIDLLVEEGVGDADAVLCVTDDDKLNLLIALLAKHLGTSKTFVRVGRSEYISLMEQVGVDVVFSPRLLTAGVILRQVRRGDVVSITLVEGAKAEAIEVEIRAGSKVVGRNLKQVKLPRHALVGAVVRNGQTFVPNGESVLNVGDRAVIFTLPHIAVDVIEFLEGR
jgi:trk system potassium uptake protein TrkA